MLHRRRNELSILGLAFVAYLLASPPILAQAPPSAERPWVIPDSAGQRAAALENTELAVPRKLYDLAALVDLAERSNPNTRAAWEVAREAAAAEGLVETGEPLWRFNLVPDAGEPGAETWKDPKSREHGGGSLWTPLSLDAEKGVLYVPVGNPAPDFYAACVPAPTFTLTPL